MASTPAVLLAILSITACRADEVKTPKAWPDQSKGQFVFNIFKHGPTSHIMAKPHSKKYESFYKKYESRFVDDLPSAPLGTTSIELSALSAPLNFEALNTRPLLNILRDHIPMTRKLFKHIGLGLTFQDQSKQELGRLAISFWPVSTEDAGKVKMEDDGPWSGDRAVTAFTLSKGNWEAGYWTHANPIETLNVDKYPKMKFLFKDFAQKHPFYRYQLLKDAVTDQTIHPYINCGSLLEKIVPELTGRDPFKEGIAPMNYRVAKVWPLEKAPVSASLLKLVPGKLTLAQYYSPDGELLDNSEKAKKWFHFAPAFLSDRNNFAHLQGAALEGKDVNLHLMSEEGPTELPK